jgi:pilus assembly protein CpaB
MKLRWILTIAVSLVLAFVAVQVADKWIRERVGAVESANVKVSPAVAAAMDIPAGTEVDATHLKVVQVPDGAKPEGSFEDPKKLIGTVAKQTIYAGEVIIPRRMSETPGISSLAAIIPKGKRAITVAVNNVVGVSGFILPGSHVDIIAAGGGQPRTILENIKVLAVGQILHREKNEPVNVTAMTLEVDPRQAEIIVKAKNLRLTLRNPDDGLLVAEKEPDAPRPESAQAPPARASLYAIDVVRGTRVSTTTIDY